MATLGECVPEDRRQLHGQRFILRNLAPGATVIVYCYGARANIHFVDVEPRHRRKGYARKAMERVLDACDSQDGGVDVYLTVNPTPVLGEDRSAIADAPTLERLYGSLGFEEFGTDENDRLIMRRPACTDDSEEAVA
jgi:GNAT superfamily N-acetyltransferase